MREIITTRGRWHNQTRSALGLYPAELSRPRFAPPSASLAGLTNETARRRLAEVGPNAMPDTAANLWRMALTRFWAPVPWMLELAVAVELALGDFVQAAVIAGPLAFNGILGFL